MEEKLEAIQGRDRHLYENNSALNTISQEQINYNSTQSSGSLLATKGGFGSLRNKDEIKDQMLASISKIKSFRETGEFEITGMSSI